MDGEPHSIRAETTSVRFLGSNAPTATILSVLDDEPAVTLCVSTTLLVNLPSTAESLDSVRMKLGVSAPRIVVGGAAFAAVPGFAREIGAIQAGGDLRDAVKALCRR